MCKDKINVNLKPSKILLEKKKINQNEWVKLIG